MKVGLLGPYSEVARLLDAPANAVPAQKGPESFENLLASIAPEGSSAGSSEPRARLAPPVAAGPMARMAFPTPSLKPPELLLDPAVITPAPQSEPAVKETAVGVKTPIIVDARRLPTAHEFSKLPSKERVEVVEKIARGFGEKYGVDPLLSMAVVSAESSFNTHAVSRDGHASKGLMQLLDTTGAELHQVAGLRDPYTPFEPAQNMELGVKHLRKLHDFFSSSTELTSNLATVPAANSASLEKLAVAAFNAGEGRVASAQDRAQRAGKDPADYAQVAPYLPDSTQEYVERVMLRKEQYENRFVG